MSELPEYILQSVLMSVDAFTLKQAVKYLFSQGITTVGKIDKTAKFYRFRQVDPAFLKKHGYTKFRTKVIIPGKIEFIFAYRK